VEDSIEDVDQACAACCTFNGHRPLLVSFQLRRAPAHQRRQLPLERTDLFLQFLVLRRQRLLARRQVVIELPPIETDLLRVVDRTDEQADPNRQELHFREGNLDVPGDDQALVEDAIENVDQTCGASVPLTKWRRHKLRILRLSRRLAWRSGRGWLSQQWQC